MATVLVAIGSNLDDPHRSIRDAIERLGQVNGITLAKQSGLRRFPPIGGPPSQQEYLNAAIQVSTEASASETMATLSKIESEMGRRRAERWGPRTIDLDLLLYDDLVCRRPDLVIPHPWMTVRRFVLQPANEIAPDMVHPVVGWRVARLFDHLCTAPPFFSFADSRHEYRELLRSASDQLGAIFLDDPGAGLTAYQSSRCLEHQIELLQTRASHTLLHFATDSEKTLLAGYWWQQSLPQAKSLLSGEDYELLMACRNEIDEGMPQFKLLFVPLAAPPLISTVEAFHQGPRLGIDTTNSERAVHDIVAAISGMQ